jgi:hypothetical protein
LKEQTGPLGTALIYIGSCLMTLNLFGWVGFGVPLRLFWVWLIIWALGIIVGVIELSCRDRRKRKL